MRSYTENQGGPDFELEKFAVNSIISATHTGEMDPQDQKDIIKKIKSSGQGDGDSEDVPTDDTEDLNVDEPTDDAGDKGFGEPDPDMEESVVIEYEENIDNNLPIGENFSIFVEKMIMSKINKENFLTETVEEVFGLLGSDMDAEPEIETPVKEPDTKEKEPSTKPTRRNKPWKVPRIKENPDPKARI